MYLQRRLKLVINSEKSQVVPTSESKFLGFTFKNGQIKWHPKTLLKLKQRIRELTNRNWGVSMRRSVEPYPLSKPVNTLLAGLITLVSPTAISFAAIWIIGYADEFAWLIGDSGESKWAASRYQSKKSFKARPV